MLLKINNQKRSQPRFNKRAVPKKQQGNVLMVTTLVLLVSITVLAVSSANNSIVNTKLNSNIIDKKRSVLAADSASRYAWDELRVNYNLDDFVNNNSHSGYFDLRVTADEGQKSYSDWIRNRSSSSWAWENQAEHKELPNKLALRDINYHVKDPSNPMRLSSTPQYAMGFYEPIVRKGTESLFCIPVSILGAAKGGLETTQTLVEINTIPKKGCFRNLVK